MDIEVDICRTYHKLPREYTSRMNTTMTCIMYKLVEIGGLSQIYIYKSQNMVSTWSEEHEDM